MIFLSREVGYCMKMMPFQSMLVRALLGRVGW